MTVDEDYVVCGSCEETFTLDRMTVFLQHKRFDCDEKPNSGESRKQLWCGFCLEKFETPWSLLKHAQTAHALQIYLQNNTRPLSQISDPNVGALQAQEARISSLQANLIALQEEVNKVVLKQTEKQSQLEANAPIKIPLQSTVSYTDTETRTIQSATSVFQNTSVSAPISDEKTFISLTEEGTEIPPVLVSDTSYSKPLNQNATPVRVNAGAKQMSVLVTKPKVVRSSPTVSKLTSGTVTTLKNKPRVFKTLPKVSPKSLIVPKTQGWSVVSESVFQVTPSNTIVQSGAPAGQEVSSSLVMVQQPKQNVVSTSSTVVLSPGQKLLATRAASLESAQVQKDNVSAPVASEDSAGWNVEASREFSMKGEPTGALLPLNISPTPKTRVISPVQTVTSTTQTGKSENSEGAMLPATKVPSESAIPKVTESTTTQESLSSATKKTGKEEDDELCCDDQDCGVTVMPGTHEKLQECCNAVLPKKRKRHMETKHWGYIKSARKRLAPKPVKKATESTIYIDFEHIDPPASEQNNKNEHHPSGILFDGSSKPQTQGSGSLAINIDDAEGSGGTLKLKPNSTSSKRSVIIPAGTTFSIPLSYTSSTSGAVGKSRIPPTTVRFPRGGTSGSSPLIQTIKQEVVSPDGHQSDFSSQGESKFSDLADIRQKRRRYPTSRPFKCDECEHSFNQRIHLKKHKSKHTGIKPFKCEQCDYSTVERSHLKVHVRVHTGEKPFKCTYCEYATAQNSTLKIHLKRHHSLGNRSSSRPSSTATSSSSTASGSTTRSNQ